MKHSPFPRWVKHAGYMAGVISSIAITLCVVCQPEHICFATSNNKVVLEYTGVTLVTSPPGVHASHLQEAEVR